MRVTYKHINDLTILTCMARSLEVADEVIKGVEGVYFGIDYNSALHTHLGFELQDSAISILELARLNKVTRGK